MAAELKDVTIFADGGCEPNPGPGGFGAVLIYRGQRREISGGYRATTNNRMELMGVICALERLKERCRVVVHSDSQYVVRPMETGTMQLRKARGFRRRKGGKLIPNADLWERLMNVCERHEMTFNWVRGHNGVTENERCDALAAAALCGPELAIDEGFEAGPVVRATEAAALFSDEMKSTQAKDDGETEEQEASASVAPAGLSSRRITLEGQPCRRCSTPVVKRVPKKREVRPGQSYYFEYYLACPACRTMFMVEAAKLPASHEP